MEKLIEAQVQVSDLRSIDELAEAWIQDLRVIDSGLIESQVGV